MNEENKYKAALENVLIDIDAIENEYEYSGEEMKNKCLGIVLSELDKVRDTEDKWAEIIVYSANTPTSTRPNNILGYVYKCKMCGYEYYSINSYLMDKCPLCEKKKIEEEIACAACYI